MIAVLVVVVVVVGSGGCGARCPGGCRGGLAVDKFQIIEKLGAMIVGLAGWTKCFWEGHRIGHRIGLVLCVVNLLAVGACINEKRH